MTKTERKIIKAIINLFLEGKGIRDIAESIELDVYVIEQLIRENCKD